MNQTTGKLGEWFLRLYRALSISGVRRTRHFRMVLRGRANGGPRRFPNLSRCSETFLTHSIEKSFDKGADPQLPATVTLNVPSWL